MSAPTQLRVEHLDDPLGLTVRAPRLSWRLPAGASRQGAYRVRAGRWDSGRVESDQSLLVPYAGPAVASGERVEWTVMVWTEAGPSDWAAPGWWEAGLLDPGDWTAQWIEPPTTKPPAAEPVSAEPVSADAPCPAWHLRGTCTFAGPVERARLYVTAHGVYEFFINGVRVGDMELTPGFTSYWSTLQVQTFDVTDLLRGGSNALGALVSGGWLKGVSLYRDTGLGLLAQLHVHGADGSLTRCGTGPDWVAARGAVRTADLRQGEVVDFREAVSDWCMPDADETGWERVTVENFDLTRLKSSPTPPVRRVSEIQPISVTRPRPDRQVVDLGQNINGWIRLSRLAPPGATLTLTYGEALGADGDVTIDHLLEIDHPPSKPFQRDQVTSGDRPDEPFEPRHTTHGFRYVRVEGHPDELGVDDLSGVVVHTDLRRTGWFECSDDRINRLHEAAVWSFRGNACDIPTDCPTRERAGWTGDWQIFVPTAAFLYDVAGFSAKWLRDLAADQQPDGLVLHCAPNAEREQYHPPGAAGWGDAAVIVPWEIYRAYGDRDLLEQQWPSMTAWVDYAARTAREQRHPSRVAARPVPAPHEAYLWDTGFHWGEWLEPGSPPPGAPADAISALVADLRTADHGNVATAYLCHSARLLAKAAVVLGEEDATRWHELALAVQHAWQTEFLRPDGAVTPENQANYARALAFGLIPDDLRSEAAGRLVGLIGAAGGHLGTGFLSTVHLLPVLADHGHDDIAYQLLFQDTEPSWLTMIDRGATTVWEHWSGLGENGLPNAPAGVGSLNHYSKGAVISFLHRYTAGIQLLDDGAPAYRRFRFAPRPGGGITWAHAAHDSPYGRIESSWRLHDGRFTLDVTVPPGTTAEVCLPDGTSREAGPGKARYVCRVLRDGRPA